MAKMQIPEPCAPIQLGEFLLGDHRYPAVYFLHDEGELVYVGQSTTLRWRIETHLQEGVKIFDEVAFIPCCVSRLLDIEAHYIRKFVPRYNQCAIAQSVREVNDMIPDPPPIRVIDGEACVGSLGLSRIMLCDREFAKAILDLLGKAHVTLIHAFQLTMSTKDIRKMPDGRWTFTVR